MIGRATCLSTYTSAYLQYIPLNLRGIKDLKANKVIIISSHIQPVKIILPPKLLSPQSIHPDQCKSNEHTLFFLHL